MRRAIREFCVLWDSEQGLPLGLLDAAIMLRDDDTFRSTTTRKQRPIEQKESYRWVTYHVDIRDFACAWHAFHEK
jgi:hypothetical protein